MESRLKTLGPFDPGNRSTIPTGCEIATAPKQLDALHSRSPEIRESIAEAIVQNVVIKEPVDHVIYFT